jgi:uncharacterized damage-inducible protein DinB
MMIDAIKTLYRYNTWANDVILDAAGRLAPAELLAPQGASFDSVRDSLVHTMGAHWIWLERWHGRSPRALIGPAECPDLPAIRARWAGIERETQTFLAGLAEARLATVIEYVNPQGERWAYPLWQQLVHQINHATQHRSEVAMILTRLGHSPGPLDLLHFVDVREPLPR